MKVKLELTRREIERLIQAVEIAYSQTHHKRELDLLEQLQKVKADWNHKQYENRSKGKSTEH